MKLLMALFLMTGGASAFAAEGSCPDITGYYYGSDGASVRFDQFDCDELVRYSAPREVRGSEVFGVRREFKLDGTPFLFDGKRGESIKLVNNTFEFTFNFKGGHRYTIEHGFCEVPLMVLTKQENGKLVGKLHAEKCEDGFAGDVPFTYTKVDRIY